MRSNKRRRSRAKELRKQWEEYTLNWLLRALFFDEHLIYHVQSFPPRHVGRPPKQRHFFVGIAHILEIGEPGSPDLGLEYDEVLLELPHKEALAFSGTIPPRDAIKMFQEYKASAIFPYHKKLPHTLS